MTQTYLNFDMDKIIKTLFDKYNRNDDNSLSKLQFFLLLKDLVIAFGGNIPSQDDTDNIFDELDINGDCKISMNQIKILLVKVLQFYAQKKSQNPDLSLSSLLGF